MKNYKTIENGAVIHQSVELTGSELLKHTFKQGHVFGMHLIDLSGKSISIDERQLPKYIDPNKEYRLEFTTKDAVNGVTIIHHNKYTIYELTEPVTNNTQATKYSMVTYSEKGRNSKDIDRKTLLALVNKYRADKTVQTKYIYAELQKIVNYVFTKGNDTIILIMKGAE